MMLWRLFRTPLGLGELENGGDDDLAGVLGQQPFQILDTAVRLLQVRRVGRVEGARRSACIEVDAVDHDDHRRVPERRVQAQLARREQHQQRLAGALEVPDETLLGVAGDDALDDAVRRLDLLVTGDDLGAPPALARGVGRVAAQQIQNRVRAEHRRDGPLDPFELRRVGVVVRPPGSPEIDRQADRTVAQILALGGDRAEVRHEQLRHVAFVVVVDLRRPVEPALARPYRRLRLDDDQRQAVHQQHEVRAALVRTRSDGVLGADDVLVSLDILEVNEPHGDVLAVGAERHRPLSGEPRCEFLVRLDQPVRPHAHQDGPQPVQDVVGPIRLRRDLRVEADQRLPHVVLDEDLVHLPRQVLRPEVVPTEAGDRAVAPREAGSGGRVVGDAAAKDVTDERLDRVRLGEGHAGKLIGCRYDAPPPWVGWITSNVVSGSLANISISSR